MSALVPSGLYLLFAALTIPLGPAEKPARTEPELSATDLGLEVQALRALYLLRVTPEQVQRLQQIAKDVARPDREREKARVSEGYRRALADLRNALAADADDKVQDLEDHLSELTDKEDPELDDEVRVTRAAKRRVPEVLRIFRPNQLAGYLGSAADEIGDPQERLVAALAQVRSEKGGDWEEVRDDLADDLGWLLGGLDATRTLAVHEEVVALLNKVHAMTDEQFGKEKESLEKEARRVGADVPATDVLRHGLERALARLLSNPRLVSALQARTK